MRSWFTAVLLMLLLILTEAQTHAQSTFDDKWALIVGVSNYADPSLNTNNCADNARKFHAFLTKEANFAPDHCRLIVDADATRRNVIESIGDKYLPRCANPNDLVVLYFAGTTSRSSEDVQGVNYFLFSDSERDKLYQTGLSLQEITGLTRSRLMCKNIVYIIDGEFADAALKSSPRSRFENVTSRDRERSPAIICSGNLTKNGKNDNSVFLKKLIDALKSRGQSTTIADALKQTGFQSTSQNAAESEISIGSAPTHPRALPPYIK